MPADMTEEEKKKSGTAWGPEQEDAAKELALKNWKKNGLIPYEKHLARAQELVKEKQALTTVDNKNYQYGGTANGAEEAANRYRAWAEGAQNRQGEQIDYSQANQYAGMMGERAQGKSLMATMMADRQMGQMAAEQTSQAASARGPAALALAQQQAANNTAQGSGVISNMAQINAAQEKSAAEQAAFGAYAGMAQNQAAMNDAQRGRNDNAMLGMTGFETGVRQTQLSADMGFQGQKNATGMAYAQLEAQRKAAEDAKNAGRDAAAFQAAATVGAGAAGMMAGGPAGAAMATSAVPKKPPGGTASDERAKVPVTWGDTIAPGNSVAPSTWGGGPGTAAVDLDVDNHAAIARQALDDQAMREAGPGPSAFGGIEVLQRRDAEDVAMGKAYERNGFKPTKDQSLMRSVIERRLKNEGVGEDGNPAPSDAAKVAPKAQEEKGSKLGNLAAALGKGFITANSRQPAAIPQFIQPMHAPQIPQFQRMTSDAHAKQQAFLDGMNHADKMQQTGEVPTAPSYMPNTPSRGNGVREMVTHEKRTAPGKTASIPMQSDTDPMADANRSMRAEPYAYKPEFAAAEGQAPGEVNVGPMAQNMAQSPAAATAVKTDPNTGKLVLDTSKFTKVIAGGVASLQRQQDETKQALSLMAQRMMGKKHRGAEAPEGRGGFDEESLGPSGAGNRDLPDYNFQKTGSPLDVATALETDPNAISPETEAHMRRNGLWTAKTDELLRTRGLRGAR